MRDIAITLLNVLLFSLFTNKRNTDTAFASMAQRLNFCFKRKGEQIAVQFDLLNGNKN